MSAFYYFLQSLNPEIRAKSILKPYRGLFKSIGRVRDLHIAENLILELDKPRQDLNKLKSVERSMYREFKKLVNEKIITRIKVPTVRSFGIKDEDILSGKKPYTDNLLSLVGILDKRMTQDAWHKRRITLKKYHHTLDAFQFCPGQAVSEEELKEIRMLEQLLGDWHDRVITVNLLSTFSLKDEADILHELKRQEKSLLETVRIYHRKFVSNNPSGHPNRMI